MGKRFTSAQKVEVIDLHIHDGYSTRRLSKEFAIGRSTIQNWLRAYRELTGEKPLSNSANMGQISSNTEKAAKVLMLNEIKMQIEVLESF